MSADAAAVAGLFLVLLVGAILGACACAGARKAHNTDNE